MEDTAQTVIVETTFRPDEGRLLTAVLFWSINAWSRRGQRHVNSGRFLKIRSRYVQNAELGLNAVAGRRRLLINDDADALWTIAEINLRIPVRFVDGEESRNGLLSNEVQAIGVSRQLQDMCAFESLTDFVFITSTSDRKQLHVHRAILAASSEYFLAMFDGNWMGVVSGVCELSDIDYDTLQMIIDHIYGSDVKARLASENAEKLLTAAHLFQLPAVCAMCVPVLSTTISPENAGYRFLLGKQYGLEEVSKAAMECILRNSHRFVDGEAPQPEQVSIPASLLEKELLTTLVKTRVSLDACEQALARATTLDNAAEHFLLAQQHDLDVLCNAALDCIWSDYHRFIDEDKLEHIIMQGSQMEKTFHRMVRWRGLGGKPPISADVVDWSADGNDSDSDSDASFP